MNHDALFKLLLKRPVILRSFFEAFLPEAAPFIDFGVLELVDKERATIDGKKRTGDLLIKTRFRGQPAGFLIHLEHQAQPDSHLGRRMLEYFLLDWRDYDLPVYPVAVLSHRCACPGEIIPLIIDFPDGRVLEFSFKVIRLADMRAGDHVNLRNPAALALASRMRADRRKRVALMRDLLVTLAQMRLSRKDQQLVLDFYSAYQTLDDAEFLQLEEEVAKVVPDMVREKALQLTNPFIEHGMRRGREQGLQEGRRREAELVSRQLARRLGPLSRSQQATIRKLSISRIEALGEALFDFNSRADLARWLRRPSPDE